MSSEMVRNVVNVVAIVDSVCLRYHLRSSQGYTHQTIRIGHWLHHISSHSSSRFIWPPKKHVRRKPSIFRVRVAKSHWNDEKKMWLARCRIAIEIICFPPSYLLWTKYLWWMDRIEPRMVSSILTDVMVDKFMRISANTYICRIRYYETKNVINSYKRRKICDVTVGCGATVVSATTTIFRIQS